MKDNSSGGDAVTAIEDLVARLESLEGSRIVAIIGPPGSGKSTLASEISRMLSRPHQIVPMDGFHYPQEILRQLGRRERMGAPDTFDATGLATLLTRVVARDETVLFPDFDRTIEEPVPDAIEVTPEHELVILEGNYLLLDQHDWPQVGAFVEVAIYIDIPDEIRMERLIDRHIRFGKDPEHARAWVESVDVPNARTIEATAHRADIHYRPQTTASGR